MHPSSPLHIHTQKNTKKKQIEKVCLYKMNDFAKNQSISPAVCVFSCSFGEEKSADGEKERKKGRKERIRWYSIQ